MVLRNSRRGVAATVAFAFLGLLVAAAPAAATSFDPEAKILPFTTGDGAREDFFGWSVAVSSDRAAFGVPFDSIGARSSRGSVYVFRLVGSSWQLETKLSGDDSIGAMFGSGVAFAGTSLVVGAPGEAGRSGMVYVFDRGANGWAESARIVPGDSLDERGFGYEVAASGNRIVVGSGGYDFPSSICSYTNHAHSYERTGSSWVDSGLIVAPASAVDACFGSRVAIDGDRALVAASAEASASGSGAAYTFTRAGNAWALEQRLAPSGTNNAAQFGNSVAISGNVLAVGAPASPQGRAYVFTRTTGPWAQSAAVGDAAGPTNDRFGDAVAVAGGRVFVGAPYADAAGAVWVYGPSGSTWVRTAIATRSDPRDRGSLGYTVAASGDRLVAGRYTGSPEGDRYQGGALAFERQSTSWVLRNSLDAGAGAAYFGFGASLDLDGERLAIGSPSMRTKFFGGDIEAAGYADIHERNGGSWQRVAHLTPPAGQSFKGFGSCVALDGDGVLVTASEGSTSSAPSGKAWLYSRAGGWSLDRELVAPVSGGWYLGYRCARSGSLIALAEDNPTSLVVFRRSGATWAFDGRVPITGSNYIASLAIAGDTVLVGVAGQVRAFASSGGAWTETQAILPGAGASNSFGNSVAVDGNTIYIGAPDVGPGRVEVHERTNAATPFQYSGMFGPTIGDISEYFGYRLALRDGRLLVGGTSGSHLFARAGATWSFDALGPRAGVAVAQSFMVTSDPIEDGDGLYGNPSEGRVRVFAITDTLFRDGFE